MPKMLTLSEPKVSKTVIGRMVEWFLLDENGDGYYISWIEYTFDTLTPKCMAFLIEPDGCAARLPEWYGLAVSYNHDAALALNEVIEQLKEKHGYEYVIDLEPTQIMPGEVVAQC